MIKRNFGLIGKTLKHSFSKQYFAEKFERENIRNAAYELYELKTIQEIQKVFNVPGLVGFNITIPYKEEIKPFLDDLAESAEKVGAVNVVKIQKDGRKTGYNSDYYGFKESLEKWADTSKIPHALVLGTGGASKAIIEALRDLNVEVKIVSRNAGKADLTYHDIKLDAKIIKNHPLIVNCTPLGTFPDVESKPDLDYGQLTENHYLYDLVYNPETTAFMQEGHKRGAKVKNGLEMLILQAEKSWQIWNED